MPLLDLANELGEHPGGGNLLSELSCFAVESLYEDDLEVEQPAWPACFAALEGLILKIEVRMADP